MKLLSTEIGENHVELIYADNSEIDDAETLLVWRCQTETRHGKSVALNRFVALKQLQDFIRQQMEADEMASNLGN